MRKIILIYLLIFCSIFKVIHAQGNNAIKVPQNETFESSIYFSLDIVSRYIWRGQPSGGKHIAAQPTFEWYALDNLTFGVWGTTNFQNKDYNSDGFTPKGYVELDLYISYILNSFLTIELYDYYSPTLDKNEDIDTDFFNYGENGVKTLDLNLVANFSEIWLPLKATVSTFLAGNDFRYNENDLNPKQNFTTYVELGYTFKSVFKTFDVIPTLGAVLNNKAKYYYYADYNKPSFVNLNLEFSKTFQLNKSINLPISINYIHNAATKNTEPVGRNFITTKLTFEY